MKLHRFVFKQLPALSLSTALAFVFLTAAAPDASASGHQAVASRISEEVSSSQLTQLPGSLHPLAESGVETGRLSSNTRLEGISIYFNRTNAQQAALQKLLLAQQNPASPQYHQWLTPEQFGSRFGMAEADLAKVQNWLEQQGFSIDSVSLARNVIHFSGNVRQVESAFATEMHTFRVGSGSSVETHFAPSTMLSVPAALAPVVFAIHNLDDLRPRSHLVRRTNASPRPKPAFTSFDNSGLYFAPGDITTVYDIQKLYNSSNTGAGQTIAIVGQSAVDLGDIEAFQSASGLTVKDPKTVLVPSTGSSSFSSGDESESDLDLEWSGAIAKGAQITFVYTGSSSNSGAFDAITYAIDNQIGTIISSSYGECEAELGGFSLESSFEQAAAQGQTVVAASGDDGSTDCFAGNGVTSPPVSEQEALAVDYPASSPFVTGIGGTEISQSSSSYETPGSSYWSSANGSSDIVSSALQYIPEQAWNEDTPSCGYSDCISSGGGGASTLFSKPAWQTGVTGIPNDGKRDVPDISLNASVNSPGYLFCSSDTSDWASDQQSSCTSGFRDSASLELTYAGGTSFGAPIFAGMLAIINQQKSYTSGQGLANPTLYTLASDATTYASGFHDITVGTNECLAGSGYCNGKIGFTAATGYDQATGLGSVDLYNLATVWPTNTGTALIGTTTTVSASNTSPALNASDTFTITVAADNGTAIPTGTVTITVDSGTPITGKTLTADGTYVYTTSFATAGTHSIVVTYSGDTTHSPSTGSVSVNVPAVTSGVGSFTLAATNVAVTQGTSGNSTITVTPKSGYLGTVDLTFDTSNDNALQNLCYQFTTSTSTGDGTVIVSGTAAANTQLSFDTNASDCLGNTANLKSKHAFRTLHKSGTTRAANSNKQGLPVAPMGLAFAGLMLFGFVGRYARKFRSIAGVLLLVAVGFAISACGSNHSNTVSNPPKGTYTITLSGQDTSASTVPTATTTFTLTIQ